MTTSDRAGGGVTQAGGCGGFWLVLARSGSFWLVLARSGSFWLVLARPGCRSAAFSCFCMLHVDPPPEGLRKSVWICLDMSGYVWMCLDVRISDCLDVWISMWICLDLSGFVWICVCEHLSLVCEHLPLTRDFCVNVQTQALLPTRSIRSHQRGHALHVLRQQLPSTCTSTYSPAYYLTYLQFSTTAIASAF